MKGGVVPPGIEPGTHGFSVRTIIMFFLGNPLDCGCKGTKKK